METWENKVAVVTGGASGIGLAIARGLVRRRVSVVLADIEQTALDAAVQELRGAGGTIVAHRTDVSDFASMEKLATFSSDTFGTVHLLFNNAGVSITGPSSAMSLDDWRWVMGVNVGGVIHGIKAFVPMMLEHGQEAYVVNTGSLASFCGHGDHAPYCASKAAVLSISQSLYSEMRATMTRVGVSVVCPGMVSTRINRSWRNRPKDDVPWSDRERDDPELVAASNEIQNSGVSAETVAEAVFEGLLADRFYIFTNAGSDIFVRSSLDRAIAGQNPIVSTWGADLREPSEREWSPWAGFASHADAR
ncbi:MAG: SDR family NAD(P)-dependent oxidoreductase [Candidatus Eremiobacteraeota bacterium]|nr:SDR family NAD(P)-dependent oxidoreductase [Candidatus Eremiobacteraeota bacterium]